MRPGRVSELIPVAPNSNTNLLHDSPKDRVLNFQTRKLWARTMFSKSEVVQCFDEVNAALMCDGFSTRTIKKRLTNLEHYETEPFKRPTCMQESVREFTMVSL